MNLLRPCLQIALSGLLVWTLALPLQAAAEESSPPAPELPYIARPEIGQFIDEMVSQHGFDREALRSYFAAAQKDESALRAIVPPIHPKARSWHVYRANFIETRRIKKGLEFRKAHLATLQRAEERYGVPQDIIVAIIGVETFYGNAMGNHQIFSALVSLAFDYPPRAALFRRELSELLLLARDMGRSPLSYTGSFAGALGMPQFLPSSQRKYAVDFNEDGSLDLSADPEDAIGSVASFLAAHGWEKGGSVALRARTKGQSYTVLEDGKVDPQFSPEELKAHGVSALGKMPLDKAALIDLSTPGKATEYWLGYRNFYVITRYNRSSFYAMAVYQLAEKLRKGDTTGYKQTRKPKASKRGSKT